MHSTKSVSINDDTVTTWIGLSSAGGTAGRPAGVRVGFAMKSVIFSLAVRLLVIPFVPPGLGGAGPAWAVVFSCRGSRVSLLLLLVLLLLLSLASTSSSGTTEVLDLLGTQKERRFRGSASTPAGRRSPSPLTSPSSLCLTSSTLKEKGICSSRGWMMFAKKPTESLTTPLCTPAILAG